VAGPAAAYGPWQTVWKRHATWSRDGTWARLLTAVQAQADAAGELDWLVGWTRRWSGSTTTPPASAMSGGAGSNHNHRCAEPADHALGRSRGGWTTKIHAACDGAGRPLALHLTGGNVNDTTQFAQVLAGICVPRLGPGRPRTRPGYVVADKGYSSRANRALLRSRGIGHTIAEPPTSRRTGGVAAAAAAARSAMTAAATPAATTSNAASTGSSSGAASPPATARPPPTTAARSTWPPCSCGPPHEPGDTP